jgi:uncharacterized membrane protein
MVCREKERKTMITVEKSIIINKPLKEVFDFVALASTYREMSPDVTEVIEHGPRNTVGSSWTEVRKLLGQEMRTTSEVTAYEPYKGAAYKVIKGPVPYETKISYETVEGGTKYTIKLTGEPKGFFKLAEGVVASQIGKTLEDSTQRLKDMLEKG